MNEQTKKDIDYCVEYSMRNVKKIDKSDSVVDQNNYYIRALKLDIKNGILSIIFFDPISKKEIVSSMLEMEYIIHNKIHDIGGRALLWLNQINKLCFQNPNWNFSILLTITDRPVLKNKTYLCVSSSKSESNAIPIPAVWDYFSFDDKFSFDKKIKKINFVGSVSIIKDVLGPKGMYGQRGAFCSWAEEYKDDIFSKVFCAVKQHRENDISERNLILRTHSFVIDYRITRKEQLEYLYLLNIEGFSTAWTRLAWHLASNSVSMYLKPITKEENPSINPVTENNYYEWYFPLFDKFVLENRQLPTIFVDHTNILQIKKQLDSDPELAKSYIEAGKKFYNDYLTEEPQLYYLQSVLDRINYLSN